MTARANAARLWRAARRRGLARIGKAGADYQEQIEGLLARFDLRRHQSLRKIEPIPLFIPAFAIPAVPAKAAIFAAMIGSLQSAQ